ncbi:MAG: shikimate dehydrogenase [Betaproteobacteria bacterium]|nr:shikimate dehydrogenase [Betaproteobacteria bacterium]
MTDKYAVIGNPVAHSKSPAIHAAFARQTGEDISYAAILAPRDGFRPVALAFRDEGGRGLNVTLPFKVEAFELATDLAVRALEAKAVNTLKFDGAAIFGDNTDGVGLVRDIQDNLGCAIGGKRVLLMGAGGASRGVMEPLLRERPAALVVANRTPGKAVALVGQFTKLAGLSPLRVAAQPYDALGGAQFDLVINATSAGLANEMPPLPHDVFAPGALAYDMVYGTDTPFLRFARAQGAATADGLGMLVEQAAESFYVWRGVRPQTRPVIERLRMQESGAGIPGGDA